MKSNIYSLPPFIFFQEIDIAVQKNITVSTWSWLSLAGFLGNMIVLSNIHLDGVVVQRMLK